MISFPIIILLSAGVAAVIAGVKTAEPSFVVSKNGGTIFVEIDKYDYFAMSAVGNQTEAQAVCKSFDPLAELAIIAGRINYNKLRLSNVPATPGTYWVNGKSILSFNDLLTDCEDVKADWSLSGISISVPVGQEQCLAFEKAAEAGDSLLKSMPCSTSLPALCSVPVSDTCNDPVTPAP